MKFNRSSALPIKKIVKENNRVKSFYFNYSLKAKPGQFLMVWIPDYDEKPFGVIKLDKNKFLISVAAVGPATKHLHQMKKGDLLGIRGPYGSYFTLPEGGKRILLVGGGYGMAPLGFLARKAITKNYYVDILLGAGRENELLDYQWLRGNQNIIIHRSTDDGSTGFEGWVTDLLVKYLDKNKPDYVYIVGPEMMQQEAVDICYQQDIPFQVSIERYMKCGLGVCGQCCVDPTGWRMCVEGPVIDHQKLKKIKEFGRYKRGASGKVIPL